MPLIRKIILMVLSIFMGLVLFSCAHFKAQPPSGFAAYKKRCTFEAVSPDGVVYRIKTVKNKPAAQLPFWSEAVLTRMRNAGYSIVDTSSISIQGNDAFIMEFAAPLGNEDQSYLVVVIYSSARLTIVEAACEVSKFQMRKPDIIKAIKEIELR